MYDIYYRFTAEPFRLSPDQKFCYSHTSYRKAKAYMAYAFMKAEGFVVVTGHPGTGKTTIIRDLLSTFERMKVELATLESTQLQADDLLRMVAYGFGVDANEPHKSRVLQSLHQRLISLHAQKRRALLVVDEAQNLSLGALEELRLLTNLQQDDKPLLQIFLLGQEELHELLQDARMVQVQQRIVAACRLQPLDAVETAAYIRHRLWQVGWDGDPHISEAVFAHIHRVSGGIPRRINLICSRLFLHASIEEAHHITLAELRGALEELRDEMLVSPGDLPHPRDDPEFGTAPVLSPPPQADELIAPEPEPEPEPEPAQPLPARPRRRRSRPRVVEAQPNERPPEEAVPASAARAAEPDVEPIPVFRDALVAAAIAVGGTLVLGALVLMVLRPGSLSAMLSALGGMI